ncbi:MFS transporter [Agromyces albus]|uniref:MFS transporter n=2 Tax=Agromyces albus TaxID=205332 RepID=A0A4Q2L0C2_9MICO|nr:MFS transporter [Agromyces albus]
MASYIDSAAIISFGILITIYSAVLGLEPAQVGIASATLTLGIAVGALIGGRLGDRFGRRPVFSVTMIVIIAGALILIFGDSFVLICVGACLVGLGTGADLPVSLSTMSEAATDQNRGKILVFSNILWLVGIVVTILLAAVVGNLGRAGAQILFGHIAVVALVVLIARLPIPESSIWLAARAERRAGVDTIRADRARVADLFRSPYLVPVLALAVFYSLVNLGFNTYGQFGTYLLVNVAGTDVSTASILGLVVIPVGFLGAIWFMRVVDKRYRFVYFRIGAVLTLAAMLVPAIFGFTTITYIVSVGLLTLGMAFAGESIMKVWTQEQFPTLLRTTAQGFVISIARFVAAGGAAVAPFIIALGAQYLFISLAVVSTIGLGVAWIVFRTRDRANAFLEEMQPDDVAPKETARV